MKKRSKSKRRAKEHIGLSPGTLLFSGERRMEHVKMHAITFNAEKYHEGAVDLHHVQRNFPQEGSITWLDVFGLHDAEVMSKLGDHFKLHPLVLEDIMNTHQRPKLEIYDDHLFIVVKMLDFIPETGEVESEQLALILNGNMVIAFQENEGDIFDNVRNRIRMSKGKIRSRSADYLAYAILDTIVDEYFYILEAIGEELDVIEENLIEKGDSGQLKRMQTLKREIISLRKQIWPVREVVNSMSRIESDYINPETVIFLRDVHDHTIQIVESIEAYRDILGSIQDLYLSVVNNKLNEVMKVLAGISTIFLPMTLVAGIYGMNFKIMPELDEPWGYYASLVLMALIGGGMYALFRLRKWL